MGGKKKKSPLLTSDSSRLDKSTLEAYVGFLISILLAVFTLTWWIRGLFLTFCAAVIADIILRSPFPYQVSRAARIVVAASSLCLLSVAGWHNITKQRLLEKFPPSTEYMTYWGMIPDEHGTIVHPGLHPWVEGHAASLVGTNGPQLMKYADEYRLMAVCFHYDATRDPGDVTDLSISAPFDIVDTPIDIMIPWNDAFIQQLAQHKATTAYQLLLVPKAWPAFTFSSVHQAVSRGAVVLQDGTGPP